MSREKDVRNFVIAFKVATFIFIFEIGAELVKTIEDSIFKCFFYLSKNLHFRGLFGPRTNFGVRSNERLMAHFSLRAQNGQFYCKILLFEFVKSKYIMGEN